MRPLIRKNGFPKTISVLFGLSLLLGVIYMNYPKPSPEIRTLKVVYPIRSFQNREILLDPRNTHTVWEYYLLENLAVGLVRDSLSDPRGYEPALAADWEQKSPKEWVFRIRDDLQWSNGDPISLEMIEAHLLGLAQNPARHTFTLKYLEKIETNKAKNEIHLKFQIPTNRSVLHELSLADASLVHPDRYDFKITSGPYFLEKDARDEHEIHLRLNPHSPLARQGSPARVKLFGMKEDDDLNEIFGKIRTDLLFAHIFPFLGFFNEIEKRHKPYILNSHPTSSYFFSFNWNHPLSDNSAVRKEFASYIYQAMKHLEEPTLIPDHQFLPVGYTGRLKSSQAQTGSINLLKKNRISIQLNPQLKGVKGLEYGLKSTAEELGLKIDLAFELSQKARENAFANFGIFKGNQKDPIGSWAFLSFNENAPLHPFKNEIYEAVKESMTTPDEELKADLMESLHRKTIDNAWLVPFAFARYRTLHSDRISLKNWNTFDLRHRFYEINWR
jgi:ABC-type transport system substrate-binding protein